ncbi:hypothetical protein B0H10DRAFT_2012805 [Mycena sp. CBHHK59/15]|nr:hypothetical protein B0H10DRAFT_2012805 [Mycena sp. CBHHK59/15]
MRFLESPPSRLRAKGLFGVPKRQVTSTVRLASIELLPANILHEIAGYISCLEEVLNCSLTSHLMRERLMPRLYAEVDLKTNKQCKALSVMAKHPGVVQHIKKLAVRPNNTEWTIPEDPINEVAVSDLLSRISVHLTSLHTFIWDGLEMPEDQLWLKLRKSCPYLVNIGTTVGEEPVEHASHVLVRLPASLEWLAHGWPPVEKLPRRFWQMIVEHCPNLEELTIGGATPVRDSSTSALSLTLGDLLMHTPPQNNGRKEPSFMAFLQSHPGLRCVTLQHVGGDTFPASLNRLPPTSLPCVGRFGGPLAYVRTLPQPWILQHLSLTGLQHSSFPRLFATLQRLTSLTSLNILIDLSFFANSTRSLQPRDHTKIFHSLLVSCPCLLHLDLLCFTQPTFSITEFSNALVDSPQLRSFILTKVHASSDEDMTQSAAHIVRQNPALENFTLRYSQDSWLTSTGIRPKHVATYEVVRGPGGAPVSLAAHECGVKSFGYHYSRRFQHKIPANAPVPQRRPSLMRLGRSLSSRSSTSSHSSVSGRSSSSRSFSSLGF